MVVVDDDLLDKGSKIFKFGVGVRKGFLKSLQGVGHGMESVASVLMQERVVGIEVKERIIKLLVAFFKTIKDLMAVFGEDLVSAQFQVEFDTHVLEVLFR